MRPWIALAVVFASTPFVIADSDTPIRVELGGTSRSGRAPWPEHLSVAATVEGALVRIEVTGWDEACAGSTEVPRFRARVTHRTITLLRVGEAPDVSCADSPHSDAFCGGPDGEMMDCPRPICRCLYHVRAEVSVARAGRYRIVVRERSRVRARSTVVVPAL
jgi:hypothetical protein